MASLPILPPSLKGRAGIQAFTPGSTFAAQNAVFRRGDFLQLIPTGTLTYPVPTGSIAAIVPSVVPTVTASGASAAATPRQVLYGYYTYQGTSLESLASPEFLIVNTVGFNATVTVPSAGAPAAATGFNLYVGLLPGGEWQQVSATALGSAATVPYLLTNSAGANRSITNPVSTTPSIFGLAVDDFDVSYANGQAAGFTNRSIFGADITSPPMGFYEQYQTKYVPLSGGLRFEMSLLQTYTPGLINTTCGISYQSAYNTFAADTAQSHTWLTIVDKVQGPTNPAYDDVGTVFDTGARVVVTVNVPGILLA